MSVLVSSDQRVLQITLDRPEKRNALNLAMCSEIVRTVAEAQQREDIACILLTAIGTVFCAGMDLDDAAKVNQLELATVHENLFSIGMKSMKPIVASVNGPALGGGLGLAAQAHVVFAGEGATFGLPEIQVGLWPFLVFRSLSVALGPRRALALSLSGRPFGAEQARECGLVHRVLDATEVEDRTQAMARRLGRASPAALMLGMRYVREAAGKSWEEAGDLAAVLRVKLMESGDFEEGRKAFKQKREAHWPSMPPEFYSKVPD